MKLLELLQKRRSVRQYTGEEIPEEALTAILQAGLLAPSGRNRQPWEFIVVRDRAMLEALSVCRPHGAGMLAGADCAIVVAADPAKTDVWCEDCSIAMTCMHLMADHVGLGSCWIQVRLRETPDGDSTSEHIKELLRLPESFEVEAILSLGRISDHPDMKTLKELQYNKIHRETFTHDEEAE